MDPEDICLWPEGTWCWGDDINDYLDFMSDDYQVLEVNSDIWKQFVKAEID